MKFSLPLIFLLAASPLAAQNVQFSGQLDQPNNVLAWDVTSSLGTINVSPSTLRMGGTFDFLLDSASAPFQSGAFNGALAYTSPTTLHGEIPNPLWFLPPLAEFDIFNLEMSFSAPSFTINPSTGDFDAVTSFVVTNGDYVMTGLFGNANESLAGLVGLPTVISGVVSQNGGTISLWCDLDIAVDIDDPATGLTVGVSFTGEVEAFTLASDANSMHLDVPYGLTPGAASVVAFSNATPSNTVFLAASNRGRGTFSIPSLGVTLGMHNPQHVATTASDTVGAGTFNLVAPGSLSGASVLLQCVQNGKVSNVAGTFIL